jgi:hypothetical protein
MKPTVTKIFLVAPLGIRKEDLERNNFINAYSYDEERETIDEYTVYLLFNPPVPEVFNEFVEREYIRNKNLIRDYDYNNGLSVLEYHIDEKWHEDVDKIKAGMYSSVSEEFKKLFPKKVKINSGIFRKESESLQSRIFRKDSTLKEYWENKTGAYISDDMEVWDGWDKEKETLKINEIIWKGQKK